MTKAFSDFAPSQALVGEEGGRPTGLLKRGEKADGDKDSLEAGHAIVRV